MLADQQIRERHMQRSEDRNKVYDRDGKRGTMSMIQKRIRSRESMKYRQKEREE